MKNHFGMDWSFSFVMKMYSNLISCFLRLSKMYLDCPILNCKHIFRIGTPHDLLQNRALHCSGHTKSCRIRNNRQIQPTNNKYIEYGWKCSNSHIIRICSTSRIMMGVLPLVDFPLDNIHIFHICNPRGCCIEW